MNTDFDLELTTPTIKVHDGVADYIKKFIKPNEAGTYQVRIELAPGGCSGHKYFLNPLDEKLDEDVTVEQDGVEFYMDGLLGDYFEGIEVMYSEGLNGTTIEVANPNAKGSCACGTSVAL